MNADRLAKVNDLGKQIRGIYAEAAAERQAEVKKRLALTGNESRRLITHMIKLRQWIGLVLCSDSRSVGMYTARGKEITADLAWLFDEIGILGQALEACRKGSHGKA